MKKNNEISSIPNVLFRKRFDGIDFSNTKRYNFKGANLRYVIFNRCNLSLVSFEGAILDHVLINLCNLNGTSFDNATISCTRIGYSDLYKTSFRNVDLSRCAIEFSCINNVYLDDANLSKTEFRGSFFENPCFINNFKRENKDFLCGKILDKPIIGYKKCLRYDSCFMVGPRRAMKNFCIVKLLIPKGSIVFCINGTKCRTNRAKVIDIDGIDGGIDKATSMRNPDFIYECGKFVTADDFDLRYNVECSTGIHFFTTREEAECYM